MVTLFTDTLGCLQTHLNGKTHASRGCLFDSCLSVSPRIQPASRCAWPLGAFTMRSGCIRRLFTRGNFRKQFGSLMTKQSGYLIFFIFAAPYSSTSMMNMFWSFFVTSLAKQGIPDYVLRVYNSKFFLLPWQSFLPTLHNMQLMQEVCQFIPTSSSWAFDETVWVEQFVMSVFRQNQSNLNLGNLLFFFFF